jgi:hypothetical protein
MQPEITISAAAFILLILLYRIIICCLIFQLYVLFIWDTFIWLFILLLFRLILILVGYDGQLVFLFDVFDNQVDNIVKKRVDILACLSRYIEMSRLVFDSLLLALLFSYAFFL